MRSLLHALPLLVVLAPAAGGVVVASLGSPRARRRVAVAATFAALGLSLGLFARAGGGASPFSVAWMTSAGASFALGGGEAIRTSTVLVLWISILALVAVLAEDARGADHDHEGDGDRDVLPVLLGTEAALMGLFLARDLLLLLSFFAAGVGGLAWLLSFARARVAAFVVLQVVVFSGFLGLFAAGYQTVQAQTGFPSTDPGRWQSMVLFPDTERAVFSLALLFTVALLPLFPFALALRRSAERTSLGTRLLLLGGFSLVGGYLLLAVFVPFLPAGAFSFAPLAIVLGGTSVIYAAASSPSSLYPLLAGYQGLFVVTLFSFGSPGELGARLWMIHAAVSLAALAVAAHGSDSALHRDVAEPSRRDLPRWRSPAIGLLLWTAAGAPGSIGFLALRETTTFSFRPLANLVALAGYVLFGWAVLRRRRTVLATSAAAGSRKRTWLLLAIVTANLAVGLYPEPWRRHLRTESKSTGAPGALESAAGSLSRSPGGGNASGADVASEIE